MSWDQFEGDDKTVKHQIGKIFNPLQSIIKLISSKSRSCVFFAQHPAWGRCWPPLQSNLLSSHYHHNHLQYCTYGVHNNFLHKPTVEFALGAQMWSTHKPTVVFAAQMQSAMPRSSVVDAATCTKRSSLCAVNNMKYTNVQFTIHSCSAYFVDASKQMFKQCLHWLQMGWLDDSLAGRIYLFPACY